jgi:DNA-binding MarR family transcriptional regulator
MADMVDVRTPQFPLADYKEAAAAYPGLDAIALYNNNLIAQFAREYITAFDRGLSQHGLAMGRHVALNLINLEGDAGITPAHLADRLGVTRGAMTGLLQSLEAAGFVARESHRGDGRMVKFVITEQGKQKIQEYWPAHAKALCRFVNTLSKKEQKQLVALLSKLSARLQILSGA